MTLTVEDGTGLPDAEAYLSVADTDAYHAAFGNSAWAEAAEDVKEAALRRATVYIDNRYRGRWPGEKLNGRGQALAWPRKYAVDRDGEDVAGDSVPAEVLAATSEAALRELTAPGSLTPDVVPSERVVSETVGPLSVTYSDKGGAGEASRPIVTIIDELLTGLIGSQSSVRVVSLARG